MKITIIT